jgi:hypothetical protein
MARPPKYNPERRNAAVGVLRLPATGRKGKIPPYPLRMHLDVDVAAREEAVWEALWKTPQAVSWERSGWTRVVARYCRMVVAAETPGSHRHCADCGAAGPDLKLDSALLAQVAGLEDRLGLSPKAMRLLLWVVDHDEVADVRAAKVSGSSGRRLMAVDPDADQEVGS